MTRFHCSNRNPTQIAELSRAIRTNLSLELSLDGKSQPDADREWASEEQDKIQREKGKPLDREHCCGDSKALAQTAHPSCGGRSAMIVPTATPSKEWAMLQILCTS